MKNRTARSAVSALVALGIATTATTASALPEQARVLPASDDVALTDATVTDAATPYYLRSFDGIEPRTVYGPAATAPVIGHSVAGAEDDADEAAGDAEFLSADVSWEARRELLWDTAKRTAVQAATRAFGNAIVMEKAVLAWSESKVRRLQSPRHAGTRPLRALLPVLAWESVQVARLTYDRAHTPTTEPSDGDYPAQAAARTAPVSVGAESRPMISGVGWGAGPFAVLLLAFAAYVARGRLFRRVTSSRVTADPTSH